MLPLGGTVFGAVYTSWFVCGACGFVESWLEKEKDLDKVRRKLPPLRP
jgi:hypothetical protein